ncbi:serine hydrolase domain-containing protein [Rubinisphaera margarita]|uniref:serine hydrolase domain-containing protein n=1 Tax=Rubinisphaera margarita TaxID=2909586 RepID=UPI001EE84912|nr:serine hydrolase domain-containing protein [Rubinisphaera margarita]MCG6156187.1 beta-lactamase family protein [Rubinisphaera margarita]
MSHAEEDWTNRRAWRSLVERVASLVDNDCFGAVGIQALNRVHSPVILRGNARPDEPVTEQSLFLVASLTKPVVAAATMSLVEAGVISLNQRVSEILPEWNRGERRRITIRQLLCHASGLPDQLPSNVELRNQRAPLDEFYRLTTEVPLDYPPGKGSRYQSMGYLVLGRLIEQLSGEPLPEFVRRTIFEPLQMHNTFLGAAEGPQRSAVLRRVIDVQLPREQADCSGHWNSDYWRSLGAPWGGMLSTPSDVLTFCREMLACYHGTGKLLSSASVREMCAPQLEFFEEMPKRERRFRSWGLGWRHNWKSHAETFGDCLPPLVVGHWGATGCLMWIDMQAESAAVICTTVPSSESRSQLVRLSNLVHTAVQQSQAHRQLTT